MLRADGYDASSHGVSTVFVTSAWQRGRYLCLSSGRGAYALRFLSSPHGPPGVCLSDGGTKICGVRNGPHCMRGAWENTRAVFVGLTRPFSNDADGEALSCEKHRRAARQLCIRVRWINVVLRSILPGSKVPTHHPSSMDCGIVTWVIPTRFRQGERMRNVHQPSALRSAHDRGYTGGRRLTFLPSPLLFRGLCSLRAFSSHSTRVDHYGAGEY